MSYTWLGAAPTIPRAPPDSIPHPLCAQEYSIAPKDNPDAGLFMPGSRGHLLGAQIVFVLLVVLWVVAMSLCMFVPLKLLGLFRVSQASVPVC